MASVPMPASAFTSKLSRGEGRSGQSPRLLSSFCALLLATSLAAQSSYVNFEGKQTSPVRLSPNGTRLFAVNTPDGRISVFDASQPSNPRLLAEIPVGVEPVSVNPRTEDEAWVVNEVSDSISIVSVSARAVVDTIQVKDEPADVVFAGGKAFVSAARRNELVAFDANTHRLLTNIALLGENPRAMAVSADGSKLYAAFALSGNHTTLLPASSAPAQPTPTNPNLPAAPQVSLIIDATNSTYYPSLIKYTMPDNDVVELDVASLTVTRYFGRVGTVNLGLAVQPGSGDLFVANTEARNLVHFEPNVRSHAVDNRVTRVQLSSATVVPIDLNSNLNYALLPNPAALSNALAQPTAIMFDPSGAFFYVAAYGSDRVAKVDSNGLVLARIDMGPALGAAADPRHKRGPRGLALNAAAQRLYVLNRIANTISLVDTAVDRVMKEIPVGSYDPTPQVIRQGRGFLYDAKLSGNGTMACAACHIDGEMDLIAWDLGDPGGQMQTNQVVLPNFNRTNTSTFHPMKGPMTTQTLRGLNALDPFHWRGDRTNFTHFNVAFSGLMGSTSLSSNDMAAYRDFINTIVYEPNPNQNLDRTYPTNFAGGNAAAGLDAFLFTNYTALLQCTTCHTAPPGPGSDRLIIAGSLLQESQDFKVPQLRAIYQKLHFDNTAGAVSIGGFGLTHDGVDPTLQVFLSRAVFVGIRNNTAIKNDLAAFVQCFDTGIAPAVGHTLTINSNNLNTAQVVSDWSLLENQAALANIDLVAKSTVSGHPRGYLYDPVLHLYQSDSTNQPPLLRNDLATELTNGDTLTLMGVPPGSGQRLGIDRDKNGILDGDEPPPRLHIVPSPGGAVLDWPLRAAGFALETSASPTGAIWTNVPDPLEIVGDRNLVTNRTTSTRFFRLRSL